MPIVKNLNHFNKWLRAYPFYYNIKKEGVELYQHALLWNLNLISNTHRS